MKFVARILMVILVFVFACKKDTQTTPSPLTVKNNAGFDEMKAYAFFQPGTYWVYEDSLHPGTLDSVWVTHSLLAYDTVKQANGGIQPGIYPYFLMQTKDVANNTREYSCYSEVANFGTHNGKLDIVVDWNSSNYYYGKYYLMNSKFVNGSESSYNGYTFYNSNIHGDLTTFKFIKDSIKVINSTYHNVVAFNNLDGVGIVYWKYNTDIYITKNIGIIKRIEVDSSKNWNLLRYNINQ